MFSKVVKLILTGGKNDKILTIAVVWACYAWIYHRFTPCHLFPRQNFLEQYCKLQQKHAIMNELWVKL